MLFAADGDVPAGAAAVAVFAAAGSPLFSFEGLAAALASPALDGAVAEAAAALGFDAAVAAAEDAGAAPAAGGFEADEEAADDGGADAAGFDEAGAGDAGVGEAAAPFTGACAVGCAAAVAVLLSGLAAGAAVVFSPSLTVVFFSALRSIVWPRVFVGRDRRGRLVIASAPCSQSGRRIAGSTRHRHSAFVHWSFIRAHGASAVFVFS